MAHAKVALPLPVLPEGWTAEKDFKAVSGLTATVQREIEPVGPHFLAHARRKRYKRTFSEDERIQAQENVKKVEDDDSGDISEDEDPLMLQRDAKDWKVNYRTLLRSTYHDANNSTTEPRPLRRPRSYQVPLQGHRRTN
jgi:DnaJ family protein C protein 2